MLVAEYKRGQKTVRLYSGPGYPIDYQSKGMRLMFQLTIQRWMMTMLEERATVSVPLHIEDFQLAASHACEAFNEALGLVPNRRDALYRRALISEFFGPVTAPLKELTVEQKATRMHARAKAFASQFKAQRSYSLQEKKKRREAENTELT